jgi:MYXO-CTERM domain-containing protein
MHCKTLMSAALVAAIAAPQVRGDTLANWTFETSGPSLTLNNSAASPMAIAEAGVFAGVSFANGLHASINTDWSSPAGNGSPESFSANEWSSGDYWQFQTSSAGYQGISIGWDQTRSSTGPATFDLQYSTDGTNFITILDDYTVLENSVANGGNWNATTSFPNYVFAPVAGPAALDDQATIWFRLSAQVAGSTTGGTNRVDNIIIEGTAIPTPGALALLGLAALTARRRRR